MGLFDLPAPLLASADRLATALMPSWLRLVLWGVMAALISMLLYRQVSAQEKIRRGKRDLSIARQRLNTFDGEFSEAWPQMADMLRQALRQVARVAWPAVLASLPLLFLLNWLSTTYGYAYPPAGTSIQIHTVPERFKAVWIEPGKKDSRAAPHILVLDEADRQISAMPIKVPVPVIHKRQWWNALFGNPNGYLPEDGPVERIRAGLPRQQHLSFGPRWVRTWEFIFFMALLAVSIGLKTAFKIE